MSVMNSLNAEKQQQILQMLSSLGMSREAVVDQLIQRVLEIKTFSRPSQEARILGEWGEVRALPALREALSRTDRIITHYIKKPSRDYNYEWDEDEWEDINPAYEIIEEAITRLEKISRSHDNAQMNGGIDIKDIGVLKTSAGERIRFNDDAIKEILYNGFNGFTPVFIRMTPIASPLMIFGLNPDGQPFDKLGVRPAAGEGAANVPAGKELEMVEI
jgi:hypothetical protein